MAHLCNLNLRTGLSAVLAFIKAVQGFRPLGSARWGMGQEIDAEVRFVWLTNGKAGHVHVTRSPERVNDVSGLKGPVDLNAAIISCMPSCDLRHISW
jgi:hypothetical protein